ncbi:hypothetical protein M0804_000858 [Polistes exclamans]|nr:hypothetical protein M0804_000858 [Polistes exclamans]
MVKATTKRTTRRWSYNTKKEDRRNMSEVKTERPRTAGRIAPTGRVTPSVHQSAGGGRRKAIPVPPPRVPTPMPSANNNQQRKVKEVKDDQDL